MTSFLLLSGKGRFELAQAEHGWVVDVLHEIFQYAKKFELTGLRDNCLLAYQAAVEETGQAPRQETKMERQQSLMDAIKELIELAEKEGLAKTHGFLRKALESVAEYSTHPEMTNTIIRFPVRDYTKD